MKLSRGARQFLKTMDWFFRGKETCWPSRKKLAEKHGCTVRQVARYLAELKGQNVLSSNRRCRSSAVYTLRTEMSLVMSSHMSSHSIELKLKNEVKKPAGREPFLMPEPWVVNEYGARLTNPAYTAVQEALRAARWRIEAANNPAAYERAIIREVLCG